MEIKLADVATLKKEDGVLLLAHSGNLPSKIGKAVKRIPEDYPTVKMATLDIQAETAAVTTLEIQDSGLTLLVFEEGEEIGRIFRAKPKELYDYAAYLAGDGAQPETRTVEDKRGMGGNQVVKPMHITEKSFKSAVIKSKVPVLVDMWAPWCGPCNMIAPVLDKLAAEMDGQLRIAKVNVDENQKLSRQYGVQSIPTMLIFKNGKEVDRLIGALPENQIRQRLQEWI